MSISRYTCSANVCKVIDEQKKRNKRNDSKRDSVEEELHHEIYDEMMVSLRVGNQELGNLRKLETILV